jgi:hypothetical protein
MVDIFNGVKFIEPTETGDVDWDQARESRLQLYEKRWLQGRECFSNKLITKAEDLEERQKWQKWYRRNKQNLDYGIEIAVPKEEEEENGEMLSFLECYSYPQDIV